MSDFTKNKQANALIHQVQAPYADSPEGVEKTQKFTAILRDIYKKNGKIAAIPLMKQAYLDFTGE